MPSEKEVYACHADKYDRLIQREDYQQNILKAIRSIVNLQNKDALDIGAGTGRLIRILAPFVRTITAMDISLPMIQLARDALVKSKPENWQFAVGDNAFLPIKDKSFDLVISGWSFCYLAVWGGEQWQTCLQSGLSGIKRVLRKNGCIILLETLGTGFESPNPPAHLNAYFNYLTECGFMHKWMRTDYRFKSLVEAEELADFFFGDELVKKVAKNHWVILPECTGVWWLLT